MFKFGMTDNGSMSDVDQEAKKLKRDLEGWREIILPINSILSWEKQSYPLIIVVASSLTFLLLWYIDPSLVTGLSMFGLFVTLIDYLVPIISNQFCKPEQWTATKEKKLEVICKNIAANKLFYSSVICTLYSWRYDRPKLFYVTVIGTLVTLSWIGNSINNLLLTYIVVTLTLLSPGLKNNDLFQKYSSIFNNTIGAAIGNFVGGGGSTSEEAKKKK